MKAEINIEVIERLLEGQPSNKIFKSALNVFNISKKTYKKHGCIYFISLITAIFVGVSYDTKIVMVDSVQMVLDVMLGLFGIVFTGYAFFQALINKELLIRMLVNLSEEDEEGTKSKLQETNESFVECMILNLLSIIISMLLKIIVNSISDDFLLFEDIIIDNIIASVLISFYFYLILTIIWEIKSFIFNVFQLFNSHAGARVLELFEEEDEIE